MRVQKVFKLPSRTKQAFKEECDVNKIMLKFKKLHNADFLNQMQGYSTGRYGDFDEVTDYRSALDQVRSANELFSALPAIVRKEFGNDTAQFLDFCQDPKNADRLVEMGLATKRAPKQDAPSSKSPKTPDA